MIFVRQKGFGIGRNIKLINGFVLQLNNVAIFVLKFFCSCFINREVYTHCNAFDVNKVLLMVMTLVHNDALLNSTGVKR